jgi:serine/threonine-protein kinase
VDTHVPDRIGPYEVTREIGRGGMGVVYLGHDAKLDRAVAIKALAEDFAQDQERLARFEREARVLASLSHGNIATVYGLEEDGGHRYLVMEFVEGRTLADRLADGPMHVNETLSVCAQVAAGVEAAHEEGVIHRDLKPGNIIIRPDGTPKVLDFGLAREMPARSSSSGVAASAATAPHHPVTAEGASIGTPGYMSPEQVRGMTVDRRTDNFAFGCILFECLTGRLAFGGPTATDSIAAILERQPDWSVLPPGTPPTVHLLLRRCLQKDRRRRLRDIGDARIELEQAIDDPTSTTLGLAGAALAAAARRPRRRVLSAVPWLVTLAALAALAVTWWRGRDAAAAAAPVARLTVSIPSERPLAGWPHPAISPDGRQLLLRVVEESQNVLCLRRLDQPDLQVLDGTGDAAYPVFSPDGEWIAFAQNDQIKKLSVRGGPTTTLCNAPSCRGLAWLDDGTIVVTTKRTGGLHRMLDAGGALEPITDPPGELDSHRHPYGLPDGRGVLFTSCADNTNWESSSVMVVPFDGGLPGAPRVVATEAALGQYLPTGHLLFIRRGTLMAAPFDLDRLETTGTAVPVLDDVRSVGASTPAKFAVSATGVLVYMRGGAEEERELRLVDSQGSQQPFSSHLGVFSDARLSPDGSRLALVVTEGGQTDIKILERERDLLRTLTQHEADDRTPVWSPDGRWLVFASERDGGARNLYRVRTDFSGTPERLTTSPGHQAAADFSPDGRLIILSEQRPDTQWDLLLLRLDEDGTPAGEPEDFVVRPGIQYGARFSRDGQWVCYGSNEFGSWHVYMRPVSGESGAEQISTDRGTLPMFSPAEDRIHFVSSFALPATVYAVDYSFDDGRLRVSSPEELFELRSSFARLTPGVNDDSFLMIRSTIVDDDIIEPVIVLNWFEELSRKTRRISSR